MKTVNKKLKNGFWVGLEKNLQTEHFPIVVVEGLDVVMKLEGYKRLSQEKDSEEFIWENKEGIILVLKYYMQVNSIAFFLLFDNDLFQSREETTKCIDFLYRKLDTTIGVISQYLGSPYISTTRELQVEIKGVDSVQKTKILIPIIQELYKKTEGVQLFNVDTLEQTELSTKIIFGILE